MENTQTIINKTEKANSFEFGKAGNRFKLYFDNAEDLEESIRQLKAKGIINAETE